jgi:hypothetical protein
MPSNAMVLVRWLTFPGVKLWVHKPVAVGLCNWTVFVIYIYINWWWPKIEWSKHIVIYNKTNWKAIHFCMLHRWHMINRLDVTGCYTFVLARGIIFALWHTLYPWLRPMKDLWNVIKFYSVLHVRKESLEVT